MTQGEGHSCCNGGGSTRLQGCEAAGRSFAGNCVGATLQGLRSTVRVSMTVRASTTGGKGDLRLYPVGSDSLLGSDTDRIGYHRISSV